MLNYPFEAHNTWNAAVKPKERRRNIEHSNLLHLRFRSRAAAEIIQLHCVLEFRSIFPSAGHLGFSVNNYKPLQLNSTLASKFEFEQAQVRAGWKCGNMAMWKMYDTLTRGHQRSESRKTEANYHLSDSCTRLKQVAVFSGSKIKPVASQFNHW